MTRILNRRKVHAICVGCAFTLVYLFGVPADSIDHRFVAAIGVGITAMFFGWP